MLRRVMAFGGVLLLSGCLGATGQPPAGQGGMVSPAQAKAACTATGGRYLGRKGGLMLCFHTPPDAGKVCRRSTDCTAGCLARSHTCAPVTPLIGCQQLLDSAGRLVTQCVN